MFHALVRNIFVLLTFLRRVFARFFRLKALGPFEKRPPRLDELWREGIPFRSDLKVGAMIEIPSAAIVAGSGTGAHPGKGPSLRSVIASLELARIPAPEQATADIDDWADAARWGIAKGTP